MPSTAATKLKRAKVGLGILQGQSIAKAARAAGYSASTARKPKEAGIGAERCIEAAAELFPEVDPGHLVRQARFAMQRRVNIALADDEEMKKVRISEVARLVQTCETYYGTPEADPAADVRRFADRLEWLAELGQELQRRKDGRTIEVAPVAGSEAEGG